MGQRGALGAIAAVCGAAAWYGSAGMIGGFLGLPGTLIDRLPFHSPVFGGVALALVVGVPSSWAAVLAWRDQDRWRDAVTLAGVLLVGWIAVEVVVIRQFSVLQPVCALAGAAMAWPVRRVHAVRNS